MVETQRAPDHGARVPKQRRDGRGRGYGSTASELTKKARKYYDETHRLYWEHVGDTCQAGLIEGLHPDPYRSTVLYALSESGLTDGPDGVRILDAGCGAGGPSVCMGQALPGASIVGVTISGEQARCARGFVAREGLSKRVDVMVADYHRLPLRSEWFDATLFLESTGYSDDLTHLFAEALRVTAPGGTLYVKDLFCRKTMTLQQRFELNRFDALYAQWTRSLDECATAVEDAGFECVEAEALPQATTKWFGEAMWERRGERTVRSAFGRRHRCRYDVLPLLFGQIVATKPESS